METITIKKSEYDRLKIENEELKKIFDYFKNSFFGLNDNFNNLTIKEKIKIIIEELEFAKLKLNKYNNALVNIDDILKELANNMINDILKDKYKQKGKK